jgi:hypothetical protein
MEEFLLSNLSLELLDGSNESSLQLPSRPSLLGERFGTAEEYLKGFLPLLYLEAFSSLSNSYIKQDKQVFQTHFNLNQEKLYLEPVDFSLFNGDCIILSTKELVNPTVPHLICLVFRNDETIRCKIANSTLTNLETIIKEPYLFGLKLGNITTELRIAKCLIIPSSNFWPTILNPSVNDTFPAYLDTNTFVSRAAGTLNESQVRALRSCLSFPSSGINLLQGPPGTGKTYRLN